ncbi:MAG: hypothetical protein HQK53_05610 [Oligoflexia bacterium]|nr:hypothetical protein [Oligoflexia bacterium]
MVESKIAKGSWLDKLVGAQIEVRCWRSMAFAATTVSICLTVVIVILVFKLLDDVKNQKLVLVPAIQRKMTVLNDSSLTDSFVRSVSMRVVELQEQWTYQSLEDNYQELFSSYYSHGLQELTKANLLSSDRYNHVKNHQMVSTFRIDWKRSKFGWSEKLKRAVSLVVGQRSIFINHNEPYSEKEVGYLLIANGVIPDENTPFAVRMDRMKIDDSSEDPYSNLVKQYEAAMNGVMPDEESKK